MTLLDALFIIWLVVRPLVYLMLTVVAIGLIGSLIARFK